MSYEKMFYDKGEKIAQQLESMAKRIRDNLKQENSPPLEICQEIIAEVVWGVANLELPILVRCAQRIEENK